LAFDSYANLKTTVRNTWMDLSSAVMSDQTISDIVTLAESGLNRELGPVETNQALTGVVDSRALDVSAYSIVEPIALFIADAGSEDETLVQQQPPASMAYADSSGRPSQWCMDTTSSIKLDRPCGAAYAFRFRYRQRFALSDSVTTNWLLLNHPDIYFAACMMWGATYPQDTQKGFAWNSLLEREIPRLRNTLSKQRRGTSRVDPALARIGHRPAFNFTTGQ
jgi:hypothetical protein